MRKTSLPIFLVGSVLGIASVLIPLMIYKSNKTSPQVQVAVQPILPVQQIQENSPVEQNQENPQNVEDPYDDTTSLRLFNEIKIICMVMTHTANHKTKAIHVKNTWGRKCNKLIFLSKAKDDELDVVVIDAEETRTYLWQKIKEGLKHLYDNYLNEYDWFFRADDDSYVIMENLRYMLAQYNTNTALYFGHRFAVLGVEEGYMAGGGYVLSRKALQKFQENLVNNATICKQQNESSSDDWDLGQCLQHHAISVDCRDERQQKRFFPAGMGYHLGEEDPNFWYTRNLYYNSTHGNLDCCSEIPIQFHYINAREMYFYEYLIYQNHQFGWDRKEVDPPRKLSLQEIIDASDAKSSSPNFVNHTDYHVLEDSEKY